MPRSPEDKCPACGHARERHDSEAWCYAPSEEDYTVDCECSDYFVHAGSREVFWSDELKEGSE